jgi:signal transduction histidine kinase
MQSRRLRSLRVQVLLWTIVPLIIVLLIVSFTGIGSHQSAMRRVVAEENARLSRVAASAIADRLDRYPAQLQMLAALQPQASTGSEPLAHGMIGEMEFWRVTNADTPDAGAALVRQALEARPSDASPDEPIMVADAAHGRIGWVVTEPGAAAWLVGAVPSTAIGLDTLIQTVQPSTAGAVAVVAGDGQIIEQRGATSQWQPVLDWPGVAEALAGASGFVFDETGGESVIAYSPIPGASWALVTRRPMTDLLASYMNIEQMLPIILVAAAAVSFLTLYFGLNLVVRPLRSLALQANRIGQGEYDAAAQRVGGVVEIEDLRLALDVMAQRIQRDQEALQSYLRAVTNAQEEERSRLARELHDDTVQTLIALDHKAQMVQRGLEKNPERTREQCTELRALIASAAQEVRRMSQALRPLYLEEVGLGPAVEMLAREAGAEFQLLGGECRLSAEKELALFRIVQESLSNARRHAQAETLRVMLVFGPSTVTLGVGDNGSGFQLPTKLSDMAQHGHLGLMGISERTQLIGGCLVLESQPGAGTVVVVQAPYETGNTVSADNAQMAAVWSWLQG